MMLSTLNARSREVLKHIVEAYLQTGEATGSRTLSHTLARESGLDLSPASVRNVMSDLEDAGLLYAPHTSAGRLPTAVGLKFFVDGMLEYGRLESEDQKAIEAQCAASGQNLPELLESASTIMSGISRCAGLVLAPKQTDRLRHIEFVRLNPEKALVVMVSETGLVENRLIDLPPGLPAHSLVEAGNYLSNRLSGRDFPEARSLIQKEIDTRRSEINRMSEGLVKLGLASWSEVNDEQAVLVVRGHSNLLSQIKALEEIEQIRDLFTALETKENLLKLLDAAETGQGVKIFIGAETKLYGLNDCALIVAPYSTQNQHTVGAIGVVGPLRMNYGRIIPMVDYTAEMLSRIMSSGK